jgi:hypothetical protein
MVLSLRFPHHTRLRVIKHENNFYILPLRKPLILCLAFVTEEWEDVTAGLCDRDRIRQLQNANKCQ